MYKIFGIINMYFDLEKNEEIIFSESEKKHLVPADDSIKTAEIVADKAKFIAHEIKNNLSIINLYSKITEKRIDSVSADEEVINSINNALKNIQNVLGLTMEETIDFATKNPALNLFVFDTKGSIKEGKDADFAIIDKDYNVYMTISEGHVIFKK